MGSFIIINFVSIFLFNCLRAHSFFSFFTSPPRKLFAYSGVADDAMSLLPFFFLLPDQIIVQSTEFLQSYVVPNSVLIKFIHVNISLCYKCERKTAVPNTIQDSFFAVAVVLLSVAIIKKTKRKKNWSENEIWSNLSLIKCDMDGALSRNVCYFY